MAILTVSPRARQDVTDIAGYLAAEAGARTAVKYLDLFSATYDRLAAHPESGPPRPKLGKNIRVGLVPPYLVVYRYDSIAGSVTILRILHGARSISKSLLK